MDEYKHLDTNHINIKEKDIVEELEASFLEYAMSVITSRAIPDTRDGLKPVHRRILYAMYDLGMLPNKPYKKSARVTGEVIGKYHPHGDSSVYEAMVRMAQDFSMRYPLVDGQGNFGSIDGDSAAAMRYTEARLTKFGLELLDDLDKNTVDFIPNYDGEENEPSVLPAKLPNLLANGSSGIAVAMTSKIPPHNVGELLTASIELIKQPQMSIDDLIKIVRGPDFPTGGTIMGNEGIIEAYKTGIGTLRTHAKATINNKKDKNQIIVYEIPFEVNKANLVEKIAFLSNSKKLDSITELRDETNHEGIRIVIDLKKSAQAEVVLNKLYKLSEMGKSFSIRLLSIHHNTPKLLNLKQMLEIYLSHQRTVLLRKSEQQFKIFTDKLHLTQGFVVALAKIEKVIKIIRSSDTNEIARGSLMSEFQLTNVQAKAILDLKLSRISSLEVNNLNKEIEEFTNTIAHLKDVLENRIFQDEELIKMFTELKAKFGDARKTEILEGRYDGIDNEALIPQKDIAVMLTKTGYVKRVPVEEFRVQNRGGRGAKGMKTNTHDEVLQVVFTKTHTDLLVFTNKGKVYKMRAHNVAEARKDAKGVPIQNIIDIKKSEHEVARRILAVDSYSDKLYLLFVTVQGMIKKTPLSDFAKVNRNGKIAFSLKNEDDSIFSVKLVSDNDKIIIGSSAGRAVYFAASGLRPLGRSASGVKGITLDPHAKVVSMATSYEGEYVFSISAKGFGKLSHISLYTEAKNRGGKGVYTIKTEKAGNMIGTKMVNQNDDLILVTNKGTTLRINLNSFNSKNRNTKGVKIMKLKAGEKISTLDVIKEEDKEDVSN